MRRKITLVLTGNGSVEILEEEEGASVWHGVVIGVILIIGAVFNLTLIGVATTTKHKRNIYHLVTALGFVTAYDSIVNQTLLLLFIVEWADRDSPPRFLCRFSFGSSLLALLLQFFYVASVSIASLPRKGQVPFVVLIILPPIISSVLVVPPTFLEGQIPIFYFIHRFNCGITGDSIFYSIALLVVGFGTSISVVIYFLFVIRCYFYNNEIFAWNSELESREQRYVASLLLLCLITLVPSTVLMNVTNLINSSSLKKMTTCSVSKISTGRYETALTFLKSQFNLFSPLLIFIFFKEFRKQFCNLFCFCRKNSVSSDLKVRKTVLSSKRSVSEEGTPVLFCTANGLVLKLGSNDSDSKPSLKNCDRSCLKEPFAPSVVTDISIKEDKPKKKKTGPKRKIVRFAHYVKEIPPSFTEWAGSDNERNSDT